MQEEEIDCGRRLVKQCFEYRLRERLFRAPEEGAGERAKFFPPGFPIVSDVPVPNTGGALFFIIFIASCCESEDAIDCALASY